MLTVSEVRNEAWFRPEETVSREKTLLCWVGRGGEAVNDLRRRVETELRSSILPFWLKYSVDEEYGGFRGQIANDLTIDPHAHKGLILNARILKKRGERPGHVSKKERRKVGSRVLSEKRYSAQP